MIFVYTTVANKDEGEKIAKLLLEGKLAACVNMWPITSMYLWEGEMKNENEQVLIVKTSEEKFQMIEEVIKKNHSYDVPCVAALDVKRVNPEFRAWVVESLQ